MQSSREPVIVAARSKSEDASLESFRRNCDAAVAFKDASMCGSALSLTVGADIS